MCLKQHENVTLNTVKLHVLLCNFNIKYYFIHKMFYKYHKIIYL